MKKMYKKFRSGRATVAKKTYKNKRFRCGRAVVAKDGKVKKLDLEKGGGSRYIDWYNNFMNFDDLRDYLINLYDLNDTEDEILLYDYQLQPLDVNQYNTVLKYIRDNGLNCNSTLVYLCTRSVDDDQSQDKVEKKKTKKKQTNVSTTSIENPHVVKVEPDSDSSQQNYLSSLDYSFKESTHSLVDFIRVLINQYPGDKILVQLFEQFCIMHGYICSIMNLLQQNPHLQSRNSFEVLDTLDDVQNICQSIQTLINSNEDKLNHLENFVTINKLFVQFHQNFENLRNQWIEFIQKNNESDESLSSNHQSLSDNPNYSMPRRPNQEICDIFQPLLNSLTDLLDSLNSKGLISFQGMIKWFITDLEFEQSKINLSDYQSLCNTKQKINTLQIRYTRKFNVRVLESSVYQFTGPAKQTHYRILRLMRDILSTIEQYQLKLDQNNQSSSSSENCGKRRKKSEDRLLSPPKKIKSEEHDRIDIAVYSSADV